MDRQALSLPSVREVGPTVRFALPLLSCGTIIKYINSMLYSSTIHPSILLLLLCPVLLLLEIFGLFTVLDTYS